MAVKGNSTTWKTNFKKLVQKNIATQVEFSFVSANTGKNIMLNDCLFDELLPYEIRSSPITSLSRDDNAWIATSMLVRVVDSTNDIVVIEKEFPVGVIGHKEILKGVLRNPHFDYFNDTTASEIMSRNFYLDSRKVKLSKIIQQMTQIKRQFAIIQNKKSDFTGIATKELLEIGSMSSTDIIESFNKTNSIPKFRRDSSVKEIINILVKDDVNCILLEDENLILDSFAIIERITSDLNFLKNTDDFLDLNASIFQFKTPKLIPERLEFSEICKLMLEMKYPYLITATRLWTPWDILDCLRFGVDD